jgi:hypothetical protein
MNHKELAQWARLKKLSYQFEHDATSDSEEISRIANELKLTIPNLRDRKTASQILRRYYSETVLLKNGWPKEFAVIHDGAVREGIRIVSLNGIVEGRTTGSMRKCAADKCPGWFVGIIWESGQLMYLCSEGWHYSPELDQLAIVGGGEISARFINRRDLRPRRTTNRAVLIVSKEDLSNTCTT